VSFEGGQQGVERPDPATSDRSWVLLFIARASGHRHKSLPAQTVGISLCLQWAMSGWMRRSCLDGRGVGRSDMIERDSQAKFARTGRLSLEQKIRLVARRYRASERLRKQMGSNHSKTLGGQEDGTK